MNVAAVLVFVILCGYHYQVDAQCSKCSPRWDSLFKHNGGIWKLNGKNYQCGTKNDIPVPFDYFNEGQKRMAVFRPSNGNWYIKGYGINHWGSSSNNIVIQCGTAGDKPVPADYDGAGQNSIAVFRPSNGYWYIKGPGLNNWAQSGNGNRAIQCGTRGDIPVPADYKNEGRAQLAVYRPKGGMWYIKGPGFKHWGQSKGNLAIQCGIPEDIPVPGDYFGDGVIRLAVFRPSNGYWYIKGKGFKNWAQSVGNLAIQCGTKGDIPVPYDFFNEGKLRIAVYRPSNGFWYIKGDGFKNWGASKGNIQFNAGGKNPGFIPVNMFR